MATELLRSGRAVRRSLAVAGALAATALVLAGCSGTGSSSAGGAPSGTLHIAVSSADASDAAFKAVNTAFEKKYPDVNVKFDAIPNNNYNAAKSSRLTAGNVDILIAAPVQVPKYVTTDSASDDDRSADAGAFLDLTHESFLKNYTPSLLDSIAYKGKQYTVPTGVSYYTGVFYNKAIFQKYGLSVPTTWAEFQKVCDTLQAAGVAPLGIGGKDSWPAGLTMLAAVQGLYPTQQDKNALAKDLWTQKASLDSGKPAEVLDRVSTIYKYAQTNFAGVSYASIPAAFAAGQFAMTPDGTWDQTTIDAAVGGKFDYGYFPIPTSDTAADNQLLGGKVDLRLAVPSSTKNKTAALAYLKFFSDPKNYATFVKISGTAPAEPNIPASDFLKGIAPYTSTFSPAWDTIWIANSKAGQTATFPFNYTGVAPLGSGTASQAAAASEKDWKAGF